MTIRNKWEDFEEQNLSKNASLSKASQGREIFEVPCGLRTEYQRDRDRIIHSKAFRRLMHKTQVFISPGDHYRTRLTHTLEVSAIARTIARGLRLNEDLTEAIALGHDLGHTPFGHSGEKVIDEILKKQGLHFYHNEQSLRVVEVLEKNGKGLNLTFEVRDGILGHSGKSKMPITLEGQIVRISDRVAYLNHDIDDALRGGILKEADLPKEELDILGTTNSARINKLVESIIYSSEGYNTIKMDKDIQAAMDRLRVYMFDHVYINSKAKEEEAKVERLLTELFDYYLENVDALPREYHKNGNELIVNVVDYISGMTDSYAIKIFKELFLPKGYKEKIE
ncbi:MAG: dGTPase [Fusobacteria bacterium]|nr:MAG: dGTPase [Fusobacteriota bacterium]KAF0229923.1 MAG: hypothetical protein FD182_313 [Fusobacteriota bacterium]